MLLSVTCRATLTVGREPRGTLNMPVTTRRIALPALLLSFALLGGLPLPAAAADLGGIDVSHWQGTIDWSAVKSDGVQFVFAKATEGQTFVDDQYARNSDLAGGQGIPFGAYHFARPDNGLNDAIIEADHFVKNAALRGRHLLPVLDLEVNQALTRRQLVRWTKAWLRRVESRLGVKPIIYASPSFWREEMGDTRWFARNGYRLWIAHWGAEQPSVPAANWAGRGWTLWQTSACGSVAGINGCVDLDRYSGTDIRALRIKNNR